MWNSFKNDLLEFVATVTEDTAKTVSKVLGEENEENDEDAAIALQEKLIADLKRSYESYGNPIKENHIRSYQKYLKKFNLSAFAGYIADVLDSEPEVSRFYAELVPTQISPDEFWARLFFRIKLVTCDGAATFADDDEDEEELVWEEDHPIIATSDPSAELSADTKGDEALRNELKVCNASITKLSEENAMLKSQIKILVGIPHQYNNSFCFPYSNNSPLIPPTHSSNRANRRARRPVKTTEPHTSSPSYSQSDRRGYGLSHQFPFHYLDRQVAT